MPYRDCKIYGPYTRGDGRKIVCAILPDGRRTTIPYPKYLVECNLGRKLSPNETVDHIDRLRCEDVLSVCPQCSLTFKVKRLTDVRGNIKSGRAGPFCSRRCAGTYSQQVQFGRARLPIAEVEKFKSIHYRRAKV